MKVLILEDDIDLGRSYLEILKICSDRSVVWVKSVKEMKDHAVDVFQCSVAFLDINLGTGQPSGLDAFEWLREKKYPGKVYFLTGHAQSHPLVAKALSLGAVQVLTKPMDIDEFLNMFESRTKNVAGSKKALG